MADSGLVPRWPPGCRNAWTGQLTRVVAGITCSAWAEAPACRVPNTRRAARPSKRLLKKLPEEVDKLREQYPEAKIELWSQDEHRIGLKPILRRVWARRGSRVRAVVRPRYQWI